MFRQTGSTSASCRDVQNGGARIEHGNKLWPHAQAHMGVCWQTPCEQLQCPQRMVTKDTYCMRKHSQHTGQAIKATTCTQTQKMDPKQATYTSTDFASLLASILGLLGAWGMALASDQRGRYAATMRAATARPAPMTYMPLKCAPVFSYRAPMT